MAPAYKDRDADDLAMPWAPPMMIICRAAASDGMMTELLHFPRDSSRTVREQDRSIGLRWTARFKLCQTEWASANGALQALHSATEGHQCHASSGSAQAESAQAGTRTGSGVSAGEPAGAQLPRPGLL